MVMIASTCMLSQPQHPNLLKKAKLNLPTKCVCSFRRQAGASGVIAASTFILETPMHGNWLLEAM